MAVNGTDRDEQFKDRVLGRICGNGNEEVPARLKSSVARRVTDVSDVCRCASSYRCFEGPCGLHLQGRAVQDQEGGGGKEGA